VELQSGPCMMALICCTVQFSPRQVLAGGCSLVGPETIQLTAGRAPLCASVTNCASATTLVDHSAPFRMCLTASSVDQPYPGWPKPGA